MPQLSIQKNKADYTKSALLESSQFRVASINEGLCGAVTFDAYNRRNFYKITLLLNGNSELFYANRAIKVNGPALVFTNPLVPYAWESDQAIEPEGYFCVFTEDFLQQGGRMDSLQDSSLFKAGGTPVYFLNEAQTEYITQLFVRMRYEVDTEYLYKHELVRSQLNLIIHEAIKMQPAVSYFTPPNAAARIANLFLDLLDRQFPIMSAQDALKLKKAGDYANNLSVHVNHLNAAVHEITGKSTTTHINERILTEAKSLLMHTKWSVAEIAYSLGFEYASYFNSFFKKHTSSTPMAFRRAL
ncbi:AraC family transcriptional regulator [Mucilaginibacter robiniae]|uniref:AraC family transcriptional regulator n=1 Tax=Mucilaginibacter robiniae TaxID=2728022 RepID=A0A7L5E409_9SPHI|nr:helix-turn-helix domain-containing protein [Mucilaginibacter robiniae]QJD95553.1 AraC family transcriptional regulator [Mucilaginibacter robiniae]